MLLPLRLLLHLQVLMLQQAFGLQARCHSLSSIVRPSFTILLAATPDVDKSNDDVSHGRRPQLALAGEGLAAAGEYLSKAACTLPNWYSSKEGLSGESPAVFGSGGTALTQAGESLRVLKDESSSEAMSRAISGCVSDLLVAACALEPVDLGTSLEAAALMLERVQMVAEEVKIVNDRLALFTSAASELEKAAEEFHEYGLALEAEALKSNQHDADDDGGGAGNNAGGFLQCASTELRRTAKAIRGT